MSSKQKKEKMHCFGKLKCRCQKKNGQSKKKRSSSTASNTAAATTAHQHEPSSNILSEPVPHSNSATAFVAEMLDVLLHIEEGYTANAFLSASSQHTSDPGSTFSQLVQICEDPELNSLLLPPPGLYYDQEAVGIAVAVGKNGTVPPPPSPQEIRKNGGKKEAKKEEKEGAKMAATKEATNEAAKEAFDEAARDAAMEAAKEDEAEDERKLLCD